MNKEKFHSDLVCFAVNKNKKGSEKLVDTFYEKNFELEMKNSKKLY